MVKINHQHIQSSKPAILQQESDHTSWHEVSEWYSALVGEQGHYYHQQVIFPQLKKLWKAESKIRVLDLGCGQGVLAAWLGEEIEYLGVDAARALIQQAQQRTKNTRWQFMLADATQSLNQQLHLDLNETFTDAFCILSLQNMKDQNACLANAQQALQKGGHLHLVLNHPCFRIPRQSGWGEHEKTRQVYRWINRYLVPQEIPIKTHPSNPKSSVTWSFHHSISDYSLWLNQLGMQIERIDEWTSNKLSKGKVAKQENLSRNEIPLFLYIQAVKK